jgi:hypothetical protein
MAPHQKHYRAKMRKLGWMNEAGEMVWPADIEGRRKMARGLFGCELVSDVDYWTLLAEDEINGTHQAPWASPDRQMSPEAARRREMFQTLNQGQREAVCELLQYALKGQLHSFCVGLDETLGGSTILLEHPNDNYGERLEIHSPSQGELKYEQFQWLKDFSIVFGKDERFAPEA